uniref:Uncharacterized protein n=1 Tax=Rhizophora mucronata TaxID=61149 RepID=A0A2P2R393_RHIMU
MITVGRVGLHSINCVLIVQSFSHHKRKSVLRQKWKLMICEQE